MAKKPDDIIQEIKRIELTIFNVKKELKTLKRRVAAYKGWTKRYRKQQKQLRQDKAELQQQLSCSIQEAIKAKEQRDHAIAELDNLINQIEAYKQVCEKFGKVKYADKISLIKEAEKLLFDEEVLIAINATVNKKDNPQMFTDCASVNRSLLDR